MNEVTLFDGRVVDSASEAWRAECEARFVLKLSSKRARHEYLARVLAKRGQPARDTLERLVIDVWRASRQAAGGQG